jgi:hypothetical protein
MTAICKLRFSYLGLLRLLPNRFNGPVLAEKGVMGNLICLPDAHREVTENQLIGKFISGS